MSRIIDLSYELSDKTITHPYDTPINLYQEKYLEKDKFNGFRLETGMHVGTHIDVPMHLTNQNKYISEYNLENCMGPGRIINLRNETMNSIIHNKEIKEGDIVLLYTGHDQKWGNKSYFQNYPIIEKELCDFLIDKKIKMVGIDLPSPDNYPFEIHKQFFEAGVPIIENMANLSLLLNEKSFEIIALPLKIKAEASLSRVLARIN